MKLWKESVNPPKRPFAELSKLLIPYTDKAISHW